MFGIEIIAISANCKEFYQNNKNTICNFVRCFQFQYLMDVNCSLYHTKEMVRTFQFVVLIMKCTNVPLISRADGYTRFPAKQCKIYKIYFCNFVDKIYTIGFNI